jgi:hypothetical protein
MDSGRAAIPLRGLGAMGAFRPQEPFYQFIRGGIAVRGETKSGLFAATEWNFTVRVEPDCERRHG